TALAWLTKTPSIFLIPLFGLITLIELAAHVTARPGWRWQELVNLAALWRVVRALAIWAVAAVAVYFALWPALWVNPEWTLAQVFDISRSEEHTSELQSRENLVCRLLLEKKNEEAHQH